MRHWESRERGFRTHRVRRFIGARLHRRIFLVMGVAILVAFSSAALLMHSLSDSPQMEQRQEAVQSFATRRFAEVWDNPPARDALAREVTTAFGVALILSDSNNVELLSTGGGCKKAWARLLIASTSSQTQLGSVRVCSGPFSGAPPSRLLWALFVVALVLWIAAGILARRLGHPLWKLARVTTQIGEGDLSARVRLGRHEEGEVGVLSESINRMAVRIEKQMNDQRHLLAEVSHEIRTPLARLRIITELLRDEAADARLVKDAEREIAEIDELVGQLLASSRLEFVALERRPLDGAELCREALKRLNLAPDLLRQECEETSFEGDPTLIARALSNLLRNAEDHGGHVTALTLRDEEGLLSFEVSDDGPGFSEGDDERIFDPFVQGRQVDSSRTSATLGLGLALVKRIAAAHKGSVYLRNKPDGGAVVGFALPRSVGKTS